MKTLQSGLLALYQALAATRVLDTTLGRSLFEAVYAAYKRFYEAGSIQPLRDLVAPNTVIIDVGANVGFFTLRFASWVRGEGKVIALEPEALNFARLQRAISRAQLQRVVETVQAAAADQSGPGWLEINRHHPGDHKLGTRGVPAHLTRLDDLVAKRGWPTVSLIKIDVQGAEALVLAGAEETIKRFRPSLYLEVDDPGLARYGSSARALLLPYTEAGYTLHKLHGNVLSPALDLEGVVVRAQKGYIDLLLLPPGRSRDCRTLVAEKSLPTFSSPGSELPAVRIS